MHSDIAFPTESIGGSVRKQPWIPTPMQAFPASTMLYFLGAHQAGLSRSVWSAGSLLPPSNAPGMRKREQATRTYSSPKVIHRGRGAALLPAPQPSVNNFGGDAQNHCEQLSLWLNRRVGHAGSGRRIPHSNVTTFLWRASLRDPAPCRKGILRTLRLQAQKLAETNLYKCFHPAGTACPTNV